MPRKYRNTDWPTSKRKTYDEPRKSKRRKPPLTPLEQYIEDQKRKEGGGGRPFDDPLPFAPEVR